MQTDILQYMVPAFFILIAIEAIYTHKNELDYYNLRNTLSCLACGMFTTTVEVFLKAFLLAAYVWLYNNASIFQLDDTSLSTWIFGLIIFDFIWYWAHRLSHEINFLWGGHVTHHQSEEFNLAAGLRQGALQDTLFWPLYSIMALLGFSPEMFIAQLLFNKFYGFCLHTKTIGKLPWIEGILATPSAHRVHHGINDPYIDKNHGGIFMIFDRLFGTYQAETEEVIYGVRKRYFDYNPVLAHFEWFVYMWRDAHRTKLWRDKLRIWFMPTGWRPADIEKETPKEPFNINSYQKYDAIRAPYPFTHLLMVFAVLSTLNLVLIFGYEDLSLLTLAAIAVTIAMGLGYLGRLLNQSKQLHSKS